MRPGAESGTILCIGRLYCDLIFTDVPEFPSMGTEVFAGGFGLHAGGSAFITAAHLSRLGHSASLGAFLPNAPFESFIRGELIGAGLDLTLCQSAPLGIDPQLTVAISSSSDRAFLTRRAGAAFPDIAAEDLQRLAVTHVHIGELATLVENPGIVGVSRAAGASLSLDCGWDCGLSAGDIASAIENIDLFLPNEAEFRHLRDMGLSGPKTGLTVVKQGSSGATAHCGDNQISAPASIVDVIDTTGAGDAFNAGFISAWLSRKTLPECLSAGNRQGASAISHLGGFQCANAAARGAPEFAAVSQD